MTIAASASTLCQDVEEAAVLLKQLESELRQHAYVNADSEMTAAVNKERENLTTCTTQQKDFDRQLRAALEEEVLKSSSLELQLKLANEKQQQQSLAAGNPLRKEGDDGTESLRTSELFKELAREKVILQYNLPDVLSLQSLCIAHPIRLLLCIQARVQQLCRELSDLQRDCSEIVADALAHQAEKDALRLTHAQTLTQLKDARSELKSLQVPPETIMHKADIRNESVSFLL